MDRLPMHGRGNPQQRFGTHSVIYSTMSALNCLDKEDLGHAGTEAAEHNLCIYIYCIINLVFPRERSCLLNSKERKMVRGHRKKIKKE